MAITTLPGLLDTGTHAGRPAASAVGSGALYSCTDDDLIYQSDGSSWTTWATVGGAGALADHNHTAAGGDGGDLDSPVIDGYAVLNEESTPGTAAAGTVRVWAATDGRVYSIDDAGNVFGPFDAGGGGGSSGFIAAVTADTDIVQYWPLNEAFGSTTFNDVIGGTDLTVVSSAGLAGSGIALNEDSAGDSYGMAVNAAQCLTRTAITWPTSAWTLACLSLMIPGASRAPFGQWNGAGAMVYWTGAQVHAHCGGSNIAWTPASLDLIMGKHLIAIRHTGADFQLVVDGIQRATGVAASFPLPTTNAGGAFYVGAYNTNQAPFAGLISDMMIFDAAKSDGDLAAYAALAGI